MGRAGSGAVASRARGRLPARRARRAGRRRGAAGRARRRAAAPAGACRRRCASGWRAIGGELRDDREIRVLRCRGKSYLDLLAQRAGRLRGGARRGRAPGEPRAGAGACCGCASRPASAVVPFGGGTSVVGGLEAARERFEAVISLDLGGLDRLVSVDERSLTAVLEPGLRLPEADRALGAHGLTARARAAELRVGDGRRLRGDALGRPVLDGARADRRERRRRALRDAGRRSGDARRAATAAPGRRCASSSSAPRARSARSPRSRCACARCRPRRATRAGSRARSRRAATRCAGSSSRASRPTSRACRTRRRRRWGSRWPGPAGVGRQAVGAALRRARLRRGLPARARLGGRAGAIAARRRRRRRAPALRGRGARSAAGRASRGRRSRFAGPHLRDDLLDRGVLVETLETAASVERAGGRARRGGARALEGSLGRALRRLPRLAPVSDGRLALLHRARGARTRDDPRGQWLAAKRAATRRDRRRRRHDHPPPRGRARPRAVAGGRGRARWASSCCARSRSAATPRG